MGLWTKEHAITVLPAIAVMIAVAVALRFLIGTKDIKVRMIPFQVLACILFVLEIGKQVISLSQGYDLYHLPFHFCSLFIFALPIMAFYKGKHRHTVYTITSALCASVFMIMLIYPSLIYSAANINEFFTDYMSFHTVAFHNIVMFEFILILSLGLHTPGQKGENKAIVIFTICFCVVSATMAQLLKTNYANYYSCNIPVFEDLRITLQGVIGAGITQLLYILIVSLLNILFVLMAYSLYRLLYNLTAKTSKSSAKNM